MSITDFGKKQYEKIEILTGGGRSQKVLAGNDVLSGGYSFKKFVHDAGEVSKAIPAPIKDEIKKQAVKVAMTALQDAPLLMAAAGRKPRKAKAPKEKKEVSPKKHSSKKGKLVKGSKEAKEHMAHLRSLRKK